MIRFASPKHYVEGTMYVLIAFSVIIIALSHREYESIMWNPNVFIPQLTVIANYNLRLITLVITELRHFSIFRVGVPITNLITVFQIRINTVNMFFLCDDE